MQLSEEVDKLEGSISAAKREIDSHTSQVRLLAAFALRPAVF